MWTIKYITPIEKLNSSWAQFTSGLSMPIDFCNMRGDTIDQVKVIVDSRRNDMDKHTKPDCRKRFVSMALIEDDAINIYDWIGDKDKLVLTIKQEQ